MAVVPAINLPSCFVLSHPIIDNQLFSKEGEVYGDDKRWHKHGNDKERWRKHSDDKERSLSLFFHFCRQNNKKNNNPHQFSK